MKKFISLLAIALAFTLPSRAADPLTGDVSFTITSVSALTGQQLQVIDLYGVASQKNRGDMLGIELEVTTNATAPGAARTLTVYYGVAKLGTYTVAQMSTAVSSSTISIINSASTTRVYTLPVIYLSGRYLYLYIDHTARDAGSQVTVTVRSNGLSR